MGYGVLSGDSVVCLLCATKRPMSTKYSRSESPCLVGEPGGLRAPSQHKMDDIDLVVGINTWALAVTDGRPSITRCAETS